MKKREGNDIRLVWTILVNGVAEDFSEATNISITAYQQFLSTQEVDAPLIRVNNIFTITIPASDLEIGIYDLKLTYNKPAADIEGGLGSYSVDSKEAFEVVSYSEDEDEAGSDIIAELLEVGEAIQLAQAAADEANEQAAYAETQGDYAKAKGDEAKATNDAVVLAEGDANSGRVKAENDRVTAEAARVNAEGDATKGRVKAENDRVTAEQARVDAEAARNVYEAYDNEKAYVVNNKVSSGGSSYVCISPCQGVTPPNETYWLVIASKGDTGQSSYAYYLEHTTDNPPLSEAEWAVYSKGQGDYAKEQGDYAKGIGDSYAADLALKETIADVKNIQPAVQFYKRVLADSGTVGDRSILAKHFTDKLKSLSTTQVLYFPHIGMKERTSGGNKFASKLYDAGSTNLDAIQATEATQPYIGGFIAPNEMKGLKYVQGQTQTGEIAFTEKSYAATDSWTLTFAIKANKRTAKIMLGAASYLEITATTVVLHNGSAAILSCVHSFDCGKTAIIDCQYNNGVGLIKVNNIPLVTTVTSGVIAFSKIAYASASPFDGSLYYFHLQNERLSEIESQQNYSLLRALFPEIEGVNIGNQHWATSNFEGTVTGDGTVIPEVQLATTGDELITVAANRDFSSDTGYWTKNAGTTIADGVATITGLGMPSSASAFCLWAAGQTINIGKIYKVTLKVRRTSGSGKLYVSNQYFWLIGQQYMGAYINPTSEFVEYVVYFKAAYSSRITVSGDSGSVFEIDDISLIECGWAQSTAYYDFLIAQTHTATSAAIGAAMWCYYDNSPANGAVYGKLYNWYAVSLISMYPPKGWRVPTSADLTQLSTYLGGAAVAGGKMKKEGLTYFNFGGVNVGATNESGYSSIAGGRRDENGAFDSQTRYGYAYDASGNVLILNSGNDDTSYYGSINVKRGHPIRLLRNSPVGADRQIIETGNFTTDIASTAKQIAIPFGYVVKELRVTTTTSVTAIEAKLHNTAGTAVATLITGKACNATSQTFIVTADQPTQWTDPTVRVTATGNTGLMNITAIIEKVL